MVKLIATIQSCYIPLWGFFDFIERVDEYTILGFGRVW